MKEYEESIAAYVWSFEIVEAETEDEALQLANDWFKGTFAEYSPETKEVNPFTDVVAYKPKEVTAWQKRLSEAIGLQRGLAQGAEELDRKIYVSI